MSVTITANIMITMADEKAAPVGEIQERDDLKTLAEQLYSLFEQSVAKRGG